MIKQLSVDDLNLWFDNARYEYKLANEEECIITLFESSPGRNKMMNLLTEIIEVGLVRETLIVFIDTDDNKVVLDGNRRVSLLKIYKYAELVQKYRIPFDLVEKIKSIKYVNCDIYTDLNKAYDHVESRHQGEQEGRGIVRWDPSGKQRMKEIRGDQSSIGYKILKFYEETDLPKYAFVKRNIKNISTIERILFYKCIFKDKFGFKNNGQYNVEKEEIIDKINEILEIFYTNDNEGTVNNVYYAKDVEALFSDVEPIKKNKEIQLTLELTPPFNKSDIKEHREIEFETDNNDKKYHLYNRYQITPTSLFNWVAKGINIESSIVKYYIKELTGYSLSSIDKLQNKFLYKTSPVYYRIILESAIRVFNSYIRTETNRYKFNGITPQELDRFNTTNRNVSLVSENKLYGIYLVAKKIKNQSVKDKTKLLLKRLNELNMNTENSYRIFVNDLNEIIHGSIITFDDDKLVIYDEVTLINLQLISLMINQ